MMCWNAEMRWRMTISLRHADASERLPLELVDIEPLGVRQDVQLHVDDRRGRGIRRSGSLG